MREVHTAHRERRFVPSSVPHELPGLEDLYTMLDKRFEKDEGGDVGRNCTAAGQWTLAGTLRYLAAESTYEVMDGAQIARSTSSANIRLGLGAILGCKRLRIKFPQTPQQLKEAALGFRCGISQDVIPLTRATFRL